jgi:hypothetical protein
MIQADYGSISPSFLFLSITADRVGCAFMVFTGGCSARPWTLCAFEPVYHYQLEPVASNIVAKRADLSSATNFSQLVTLDYQPAKSTHDFHFQTRRPPIILSMGRVASCVRDSTGSYSSWLNSFTCEDRQPRLLEADDHP